MVRGTGHRLAGGRWIGGPGTGWQGAGGWVE